MGIKQKTFIVVFISVFFASLGFSFLSSSSVSAYTCQYSGDGGSGRVGQYKLEMEGTGGNCYYMGPSSQGKPSDRQQVFRNGQPTGEYKCVNGTVQHDDGTCWNYKKTYTQYKPTFDDGSQISNEAYQEACQQQGTYYGRQYNYNEEYNACETAGGCWNLGYDQSNPGGGAISGGTTGQTCRKVGDGTKTAGDILGQDPKTAKVQECQKANLQIDPKTHDCKWTKEACSKKDGGQGVWIESSKECKAYSDFNQQDCVKNGGEFKIIEGGPEQGDTNNSQPDRWECVKKGTNGSEDVDPNAPDKDAECLRDGNGNCIEPGALGSVDGKCGEARTNIVSCDGEGATALGNVLRVFIIVLSIGVGIAAVGGIAYSAVQYAGASDSESNVSAAKDRIRNIVIGLLVYGFMVVIVNWLVPGGVIG